MKLYIRRQREMPASQHARSVLNVNSSSTEKFIKNQISGNQPFSIESQQRQSRSKFHLVCRLLFLGPAGQVSFAFSQH